MEFLCQAISGGIMLVEVKSGTRTRARSLQAHRNKYRPERAMKLIGGVGSSDRQDLV